MEERKIIHIDMDAFFASVEQRDRPELRGIPLAVGYDGPRGVVATASYEARSYGVRSAMSMVKAKRLCPHLTVVPGNHVRYKEVSNQVHDIMRDYTDLIEPISLDEAFLDVTENKPGIPLAVDIAREIRQRIRDELHLTASAGISYNKLLAKIASDWRKPDGMTTIHPDRALDFIAQLKVEKLWGVGPRTAERMHYMGVFTGGDLRKVPLQRLTQVFGKMGRMFYDFARGIDLRPVETEWVRKSVGCERTFLEDICKPSVVLIELYHAVEELVRRIAKSDFEGHTLTLKVKYSDFTQITRSLTVQPVLTTKDDLLPVAKRLLGEVVYSADHPIRLLGLSVSNPTLEAMSHKVEWIEGYLEFEDEETD
ncbi:MAG: DNA polymerase IV [Prevotella sp.]|nr:DNA polymerase IV [Prevotella sp.]